ncbi:hypothetical protein G6F31_018641 [Rhizopus arrhizus]|nr:hypothetical protein G6F31_018641 [Rhizopus arrhizus]
MRADHRILESRRQRHRAFQERRDAHQRRAPPEDQADRFVRKQQQAERGQHLVQVIALVQLADHQHLDRHAVQAGTQQGRQHAGQERPRGADRVGGAIRAHHVEGPVRQVHHAHDPEDQRQSGRQHEKHGAELQAVQQLFEQKRHDGILQNWA